MHLLAGLEVGPMPLVGVHSLALVSPAFAEGGRLADRFAWDRGNVSPPLGWDGVPRDAVELALLCHDPDAAGGPFVHWVVVGIAASTIGVAEGTDPASSSSGLNGFGERGWGGPAPLPGDAPHRYVFTLFAVASRLDRQEVETATALVRALDRRVLGRARLVGVYGR